MASTLWSTQPPVLGMRGIEGSGAISDTPAIDISQDEWITRARTAWEQSTKWFDASIRTQVRKNISNFRSLHPEGSKYRHESFRARSRTYRPKTRAMVRRQEAALAVAMFATSDLISVAPWNQNDAQAVMRARLKQKLMNYRLTQEETYWFLTCLGAVQDGSTSGVIISHQYWKYSTVDKTEYAIYRLDHEDGVSVGYDLRREDKQDVVENRPCVDLIPIERFRIDPACDWRDPIRSSPFVIHECPTYVGEVKQQLRTGMADAINPDKFDDTYWWAIASDDYDSIRAAREGSRIDKYAEKKGIADSQTITVRKHTHRVDGRDWYYETLGDIVMLSLPRPLVDRFPHLKEGERPYVMGMIEPEVHKVYPTSPVQLIEPLQEEINDISNLRQDTVKMSTFGRWKVRRNAAIDIGTLKAGVPQSVISVDDVNRDIEELKQRDPPQSSFLETDRLQIDMDDLSGGMTQATANANKAMNQDQTLGGMNLLEGQAGAIRELEMRVIVKSWAQPVLQQMHDMISTYESDTDVLQDVAGENNVSVQEVLDSLKQRTRVRVDVGFNATSPEKRIGRLMLGLSTMFKLIPTAQARVDAFQVQKEIMGALGFDDGERFFPNPDKVDPQVAALQQQIQQLTSMLQGKQLEYKSRLDVATVRAIGAERVATITAQVQWDIAQLANHIAFSRSQLEAIDRQLESQNNEMHAEELNLERTALLHSIEEDQRQFALKMHAALTAGNAATGSTLPRSKPPAMRVQGGDKAGTLARGQYGMLPFQEG